MKGMVELGIMSNKSTFQISRTPELADLKVLLFLYAYLIFGAYIMPQYFGLHIGVDITCTRVANVVIVIYMVLCPPILNHFFETATRCSVFIPLMVYLLVTAYTMVLRVDINAFFMPFIEIITFFMLVYGIRYVVGYKRAIKWSIGCAYFLGIYGLIEYVYGRSIFLQFLSTLPNNVSNFYRSGHYRIMGPCGHSLGYGMLLLLFVAIACYDFERDELYLFRRPVLIVILLINIFLTGSRSSLGLVGVEVVLILFFCRRERVKKTLLIAGIMMIGFLVFLAVFHSTSIGRYFLGQLTSVVDQVFGTNYAVNFGVETDRLEDSSSYREALPYIFKLEWLNPWLGRGNNFSGAEINGTFIHSIDNYYVQQYIKYAYPGLFAYALFILVLAFTLIRELRIRKSGVTKMVLVGVICYFVSLWWVDALQTLKFVYILIAIFYSKYLEDVDFGEKGRNNIISQGGN